MKPAGKAHFALIAAGFLFGANYWIAKSTMPAFSPFQIVAFRIAIVTVLLWIISLFVKTTTKVSAPDFLRIFGAGFLGVTVNQFFFFSGLEHSSPVETSILHTLSPLLVALFAVLILSEKVSLRKYAGIVCGLLGAIIIVTSGKTPELSNLHFKGNLFILINISAYSLYLVLIKPVMEKYEPLQVLKYVFLAGFITYAPIGFIYMKDASFHHVMNHEWLALAYVVIATTLLTYLLTILAIKQLPATVIGFYIYLQPFIATFIGYLTGREQLSVPKLIAAAFLFTGVWLVLGREKRNKKAEDNPIY